MCESKVLKRNEELRSCGVSAGCTVQVVNRMRGGGKHKNKKYKAEKKTTASPKDQEPERGQQEHNEDKIIQNLLSCEDAENEVIRRFEENEETRKIIARLAKEDNSDMERWTQICTEVTGLDDEQKKTVATGIRRAVEARRKGQGVSQPQAQEQGKRECVTTEEVKRKGTASTGARQESVFHRRGKGGERSARMARAIHGKKKEGT